MSLVNIQNPANYIQHDIDTHSVVSIGSPVWLEYESEVLNNSTKAEGLISVNNGSQITDGYYLDILGVRFTFATNPKPNQCPAFPTPPSTIIQSLLYQINNSATLKDLYTCTFDGVTLKIKANFTGTNYNLTISQSGAGFSTSVTNAQDGNFAESVQDYSIVVEVFIDQNGTNKQFFLSPSTPVPYGSADFVKVDELEKEYGGKNRFLFNLSETLMPYSKPYPPIIRNSGSGYGINFQRASDMIVRYAFNVYEKYIQNGILRYVPAENWGFNYDTEQVKDTLWGIRASERYEYNADKTYSSFYQRWRYKRWDGVQQISRKVYFLTHQPERKLIRRDAYEFLYFVWDRFDSLQDQLQVRVTYEFTDCTTEEVPLANIIESPGNFWGCVGCIEVSPRVIDIPAVETTFGKTLKAYFVTLWYGQSTLPTLTQYSQAQGYELRNEEQFTDLVPTLMFYNPLGGFDTLCPSGVIVKRVESDRSEYARTLQHETRETAFESQADYSKLSEVGTFATETTITYTYNSGWMDRAHYDWLRDLIQSTSVYIIDPTLERETRDLISFLPRAVRITKSSWERQSDLDEYSLSLDVELTVNRNYLPS